ncbi:MAG TPA: FtsX-like permease family protein, partial [Puia sp.]|nr:FtsX-like permease family protein [Puia sp.]
VTHYNAEKTDSSAEKPVLLQNNAEKTEKPATVNDSVLTMLKKDISVTYVSSFATKDAILKGPESFEGLKLKGVDRGYAFDHLKEFLKSGSWIHFPDSGYSNEINLSAYTANQLKLKTGDKLFAYFIQPDGSKRVRPLVVAGIFKTGIENYDRVNALVDLRLIQRLNNWSANEIGGYEIFIKDYEQADSVSDRIYNKLPHLWDSHSITEIYRSIFDWLNLQDTTIIIVIVMMVLVAILNLVTCLIILLLERTHMIGLLKSMGSRDRNIQQVFLYHGALITFGGILLGDFLGLLICWLQGRYGFITLPEDSYFIATAAVRISWQQVCWVNLGTFVVCFVVLLIPSFFIIKRLSPVKAISFN